MGSGSDAARQAAQVVLLDSDFSHMRQIIGEGRRDINNITRSATLFTYKNIFSLLLALFTVFGAFTYPLSPNQVSLISFFNIGLPAFLLSFEPNERKQKGHFITEVFLRSLPAALTSFVAIADMIVVADLFGISATDVSTASTFLLSVVGFLMLISISSPTNRYRAMVLMICLIGFCLGSWLLRDVFDIYNMSTVAWVLFHLFVLSEVGVLFIFTHLVNDARRRLPVWFPEKFGSLRE
jgi:cation-transporting ATPase E